MLLLRPTNSVKALKEKLWKKLKTETDMLRRSGTDQESGVSSEEGGESVVDIAISTAINHT